MQGVLYGDTMDFLTDKSLSRVSQATLPPELIYAATG
jgi:hypothetical protein